jgi:ABC-type transporter Mla subunit MlaD
MAGALEDLSGDLDDLAKDSAKGAEKAGDKLGDGFKDGAKVASKALDTVDDALKDTATEAKGAESKASDAFRKIAADAKASGDKVGKSQKEGFDEAESGVKEFGEEANSTAKETAASFDGSAESILGSFQEIAANAFAGFGPAGAAAGLAMAAGIGIAVTAMQGGAEAATAMRQKSVDMVDKIAEAGGNLADMDLADTIREWGREVLEDNWITFWADESSTKFQETAKDAREFGIDSRTAIRAAAGSAEDSQRFLDRTAQAWQDLNDKARQGRTESADGAITFDESAKAAMRQRDALSDLRGQAEENIKTVGNAVDIYNIESDAVDDGTAALEAKTKALEESARALDDAAGNAMSAVEAEIAYNDAMAQGAKDIKANGKGLDLHTAVGKANQQTLIDMAKASNELRDSQIAGGASTADVTAKTEEARAKFVAAALAAGMGKDAAGKLADQYGLIPKNVDTFVKAHNVAETKREIDGVAAPRTASIKLEPEGSTLERYIAGMNGRKVAVEFVPRGGVAIAP